MPKTLLALCLFGLAVIGQSCSQANSHGSYEASAEQPKTAEELRAELLVREEQSPDEQLRIKGTSRRNFIDQLVLEGTIKNTATLATFKDPILTVVWYSKTKTELDTKQYRIYELVRAKHSIPFKLKTDAPSYVATVAMGVSDATPVE
ncbi:hypothetical protein E4631_15560 [Hymenobacter sp. UV11]|uniref:hypothetical protein n=1 Tax=Hymenobacter sp. UV11 TaxID=1849735 RepID=UPI00105C353C|nr:hypothetical protein [Hymenobacter sp. UV11]TFZ65634.1 hypothetical protein E4631_15560 [Hymenobacter sp. UV11]